MPAQSVHDAFEASCARYPDNDFLYVPRAACTAYSENALRFRYRDSAALVAELRSAYGGAASAGVSRVGLMLQNRPEFFHHWLALNSLGISVVPLNHEMTAAELAYIVDHCQLRAVVALPALSATISGLRESAASPFVAFTPDQIPAQWEAQGPAPGPPGRSDECALLYTSGSTGAPKGCVLSNDYFLRSGERYLALGGLCRLEPGRDRCITPLPLVHMNAMACSTMAMLLCGGCVVQLDRFHPRSWWDSVRESGATVLHYLGVMPAILLAAAEQPEDDVSDQVRFGFGAGVNPEHHALFEQRFGFPLIEAWGMTETGNHGAIVANREPRKVGSACFGRPPEHLELRLVDDAGTDVPEGEAGELLLRCRGTDPRAGFFSGYLHDAAATAEAWADGWFHTGDMVRRDRDGDLYFVDRKKNVIRRSGENISALEVETQLSDHPGIAQAFACPVPDEIRGDEVMLCVVAAQGQDVGPELARSIFDHGYARLSYFKVPGWIAFVDDLPLTPSQKPKRGDIKALARTLVEQGMAIDLRALKRRDARAAG